VNWLRPVAVTVVAVSLLVGSGVAGSRVQAAPADWTTTVTWDWRPWGGRDYGLDLTGPGQDVQGWVGQANPVILLGHSVLALMAAKFPQAGVAATVTVDTTAAALQWCALGKTTTFHITAVATYVEKPGYSFWDRLLGREQYEERHQWFVVGCSRGA
jgi:hypothetical protein